MTTTISSPRELDKLAQNVANYLKPGDIITLTGPLAAGKTTFTQHLLRILGYSGHVSSPTFVIEHRYPINFNKIKRVIHLDLYRLTPPDLKEFDWEDYLKQEDQIVIIEWPAIASKYLPSRTKTITIDIINEKERRYTFSENFGY